MADRDTIVAAATPPGRGGVAVVRVSGPLVPAIAEALLGTLPAPRYATFSRWKDAAGALIDLGLALYFPAPHSFTGEDVLELQGHGGDVVVEALVERVVELGARRARAGEFSERAFLNDKIDLAQAEAIADLIDAGSRRAAQAAMRSLQGEFSQRVKATRAALISSARVRRSGHRFSRRGDRLPRQRRTARAARICAAKSRQRCCWPQSRAPCSRAA